MNDLTPRLRRRSTSRQLKRPLSQACKIACLAAVFFGHYSPPIPKSVMDATPHHTFEEIHLHIPVKPEPEDLTPEWFERVSDLDHCMIYF